MKPTFWHRLDLWAHHLTPFGLTFILILLNAVPLHIPGFSSIAPVLPLIAVFHWATFRPHLLPHAAVFVIGILHDLIGGHPIGINAVVFLTVYSVVSYQRQFFVAKSFTIYWLGFAVVCFGAAIETWILHSVYNAALISPSAAFFQYLMTVGTFPIIAWVFLRWQQAFLKQEVE